MQQHYFHHLRTLLQLMKLRGICSLSFHQQPHNTPSVIKWNKSFRNSKPSSPSLPLTPPLFASCKEKNEKFLRTWKNLYSTSTSTSNSTTFRVSEEVRVGVEMGEPIVCLESAIISHGMPYPDNIQTALHLQNIVRKQGAIPATVGCINGQMIVGLSDDEIQILGSDKNKERSIKVSRRDLPIVLSQKLNGGTTVSGTIIGAVKAGIEIFATGGIGGVHRGAETSFDISADLQELGRNQIAVISAGVKSILDIGKTLEYLETAGVCVAVLKQKDRNNEFVDGHERFSKSEKIGRVKFPSFFTAESQFRAPYLLSDELQAAHLVNSSIKFKLNSGILIAVPIPKEHEAGGQLIEEAIERALEKAEDMDIEGKDMTPFLLAEVNRLTSGASLAANKYLVENNVKAATQIALMLAKLRKADTKDGESANSKGSIFPQDDNQRFMGTKSSHFQVKVTTVNFGESIQKTQKRPVVVGGSSMDLIIRIEEEEVVVTDLIECLKIKQMW